MMNIPNTPSENYTRRYHKTNYYADPTKKEAANDRRKETNFLKYGNYSCTTTEVKSKNLKNWYVKQNDFLNSLEVKFGEASISEILNTEQFHYTKYIGKAGNRKMIKDDPYLYISLLHHTEKYKKYIKHKTIYFSCRLLIAGKYGFDLPKDLFCRCGKFLMFDRQSASFLERSYCRDKSCILGPNSVEKFKYQYGDNWEEMYHKLRTIPNQSEERHKKHQLAGRIAYQKRSSRTDTKFHAIGNNEKCLLDQQELKDKCIIDRNFTILGYYPDGYCHKTNTIYEVYEKHHKKTKYLEYDKRREKEITEKLNCRFVIIWDDEKK